MQADEIRVSCTLLRSARSQKQWAGEVAKRGGILWAFIGLRKCGGREVPHSAICELERKRLA